MAQRISIQVNGAAITAALNESETARAFAQLLPCDFRMSGTGIDLCAPMPEALPYDPALVHRGWRNGDVNYNPGGGWLAIFFDDEENSQRFGDQLTIGRIEGPLDQLRGCTGRFSVRIEPVP